MNKPSGPGVQITLFSRTLKQNAFVGVPNPLALPQAISEAGGSCLGKYVPQPEVKEPPRRSKIHWDIALNDYYVI